MPTIGQSHSLVCLLFGSLVCCLSSSLTNGVNVLCIQVLVCSLSCGAHGPHFMAHTLASNDLHVPYIHTEYHLSETLPPEDKLKHMGAESDKDKK